MDLNILRLHCGNRIRDAVFRKFSEIKRDSNIEIFQKEVLLRLSGGIAFLQAHLPAYYDEICIRYTDIMKNVVYGIFHDYCKAYMRVRGFICRLMNRSYEIGSADETIMVEYASCLSFTDLCIQIHSQETFSRGSCSSTSSLHSFRSSLCYRLRLLTSTATSDPCCRQPVSHLPRTTSFCVAPFA